MRYRHAARPKIDSVSKKAARIIVITQDALFAANNGSFFPTFIGPPSVGPNIPVTTCARHMCAKLCISRGYIVVFPWILIKPA